MVQKFNRVASSWPVFILSLLGFALWATLELWPASYWFEVRSVRVADGVPAMVVDRTIKRPFYGRWSASLYRWEANGWVAACTARGEQLYNPEAQLPAKLDLDWWTTGQCRGLAPGKYMMRTHWSISGAGLMPDKTVTVDSNIWSLANE